MKTPIIFGCIILSSLVLASCSGNKTQTSTTPTSLAPTKQTSTDTSMAGMDHSKMDMGTGSMTMQNEPMKMSSGQSMDHMGASTEEEFIANMIPHHQEAVDSASIIVAKTQNAELKKIATDIISAQKSEIVLLNSWMKSWYPNTTIKVSYMQMMRDLSRLSDHDLDDVFMQDMIKHHEGAVHMSEEVLDVTQRPEIVTLAKNIIKTQNEEITTFKKMLNNH